MEIKQLSPTLFMEIANMEQHLSPQTISKIEFIVNRARFEIVGVERDRAIDGSTRYTVKEFSTSYVMNRTVSNQSTFTKEEMRRYFQEKMYYILLKERLKEERKPSFQEGDIF